MTDSSNPKEHLQADNMVSPTNETGHHHHRLGKKVRRGFLILAAGLVVVAAVIIYPLMLGGATKEVLIRVPKNATYEIVHDSVEKYLGKTYADHVVLSLKIFGMEEKDRHGAYLIEKGMSPLKAGRRISRGGQTGVTLTINGQRTKEDLARKIASVLDISEEEMLKALNDPSILSDQETDPNKVITFFLNNSYEFYWTATPKDVISKMHEEYGNFWNNDRLMKAEALRLSPRSVCIIASITDEETNDPSEKGRIGRLYINRINTGMPLQADPTVRYALNDFTIKRISLEDTKTPSPYNTYLVKGLPPGPIRTPDPATIDAILNSSASDDLYMCADTSFNGRHFFSSDYDTHKRYAAMYREALNRRNIHR